MPDDFSSTWPHVTGEMAKRIGAFEWSRTPLGAIEDWPPSLRTSVDLVLGSPVATVLLWGPAHIQIYNDHWRDMMGAKHPAALGQPTHECFPEIAETMAPLYERVEKGEAVILQNTPLPIDRSGGVSEAWWNVHYLPVRNEVGAVAGILCTVMETTASVLADREREAAVAAFRAGEERQTFLLKLSDALRPLSDPIAVQTTAMKLLAERLDVMRATYFEIGEDQDAFQLTARFERDAVPIPERMRLSDFSAALIDGYRSGRTLWASDTAVRSEFVEHPEAYLAIGVRAWAAVPLVRNGRLVAWVGVHSSTPRDWSPADLRVLEDVAERTWAAVDLAFVQRRTEQHNAFVVRFSETVDGLADAGSIAEAACRLIAEALGAERTYWSEIDWETREFVIGAAFHEKDVPAVTGRFPMDAWEPFTGDHLAGRPVVVDDVQADPRISASMKEGYARIAVGADLAVDVTINRTLRAVLAVNQRHPRHWTREDIALVQGISGRTWAAVERARAEGRRNRSEARFRSFVTTSSDVVYRMSPDWTEMRQLDGRGFLSDTPEPSAAWMDRYIHPEDQPIVRHAIEAAVRTKSLFELEHRVWQSDGSLGWTLSRAVPILDDAGEITEWLGAASNVTERKAAAEALREREQRQAFLLAFSDALRAEPSADAVAERAIRMLAEEMQLDRCYITFYRPDDDEADFPYQVGNDTVPPLPPKVRLSDFPDAYERVREKTFVLDDDFGRRGLSEAERANSGALGMRAMLASTVRRGEMNPLCSMAAVSSRPRHWSPAEIVLVEEAAERTWAALERARAETALRESDARHRLLIGSLAQAVWDADAEGVVMADSPSWRAYTGQTLEEWLGYGWLNAIHPDDRAYAERQWREAIAAHRLVDAEFRFRSPDGEWRWTNVRAAPVRDAAGKIEKWAGMNIDIDARKRADAALRESEGKYRALFEFMDEAYAVVEVLKDGAGRWADFRFLDANPAFMEHTAMPYPVGRTATELLGSPNPRWTELYGQALEADEPIRVEENEPTLGRTFDLNVFSLDRERNQVAVLFTNITARKQAEIALAASEMMLRRFGEASTDVLWIRDAETLNWTYLTPAFEAIYGLPRDEALAGNNFRNWVELILPEDRDRAVDTIRQVRNGESVTFEYRVRRPNDGAVRWLRNTDFPIRGADGRVTAIGGVGHDASHEKEADRIIRASRRQMRTLIEGVPQLVWRGVDGGEWTWSSPQWTSFTGLSEAASIGRGWLAAVHPDDRERAMDAWRRAEATEEPLEVEYRIRQAGGEGYRWFQTRALPVRDEETGRILEWLGTSTDMDDMRAMQEEQAVMVAELQHRTRNLIAVVGSIATQTMAQTGPTEAFQAEFKDRLEALSRVQGLLSQAGDDRITIGDVVEMELKALGSALLRDRVTVEGPDVPLRKSIVQTMALAIHELATNARKYGALSNGSGELAVRWTMGSAAENDRRLFFEWIESGVAVRFADGAAVVQGGGYGRKLIEESLPYSLKAKTRYEIGPDGLTCTIDLPLAKSRRSRS